MEGNETVAVTDSWCIERSFPRNVGEDFSGRVGLNGSSMWCYRWDVRGIWKGDVVLMWCGQLLPEILVMLSQVWYSPAQARALLWDHLLGRDLKISWFADRGLCWCDRHRKEELQAEGCTVSWAALRGAGRAYSFSMSRAPASSSQGLRRSLLYWGCQDL